MARYHASLGDETVRLSAVQDVVESDAVLPAGLAAELRAALAPLERAHAARTQLLAGPDHSVADLVDPSLYPLVYGVSRR